ncbi:MAG TPA: sigma 54-interacting transcriptional regulator [Planctomycetota bacterium]|nr:sigma 54-interacting transcriptional regulator [Planctomycetota bacterium]
MDASSAESPSELERLRRRVAELEATESLLAREQAARSELANVLEHLSDAFICLNDVWQYTYVSKKAAEIFGRTPEDLIGKHLWTEFPEGVAQKFHHAYYKALADQVPIILEEYYAPWDRWFENRIYPAKNGLSIFFTDITERKKADEDRTRLLALTEETTSLVAFADADGVLLQLNPAGRRMLGIPPDEKQLSGILRYLPERLHRRHVSEVLPSALREGVWRGESALLSLDGRETPVSLAILVHKRPDASTESLSIIARDISPQKLQEAKLRESEARYRTIVENAPEAVLMLDVGTRRFVDFNDNALRLFGYTRDQLSIMGPADLSPPLQPGGRSSEEAAAERLEQAASGGRPVFDWIHRTARGVEFPCEVRLVRVPSETSVLIRGSILDISERKRAEEALRESEARFRQIAETVRDVFWIGTPDLSEILYVSPAFEEIWGRPRKELYRSAATWNQAIHPDDGGSALRSVSSGGRMDNTYRIIRPDGEIRWIRERAFPILDAGGLAYRVVGVAEDVTDVKEAEAELRESRRQLEEALKNTQDRMVQLEEQVRGRSRLGMIVGKSAAMQELYRRIRLAGQSPVNVLITGESGTGKEMSARAIHDQGVRKGGPFIAVNCSAIPESLLESELFGHVKGAFTGAVRDKPGLFQSAEGGTLFLDEVGDMPASLQVKVLRALQEREIRRVGDEKPIKVDVHLITATNRGLKQLIESGAMREDFYYRIRVFEIRLPSLRERKDDIPLLVSHFVEEFSLSKRKKIRGISAEAMRFLMDYPWPGNVRELRNTLEHAFVTVTGDTIRLSDFPAALRNPSPDVARPVALQSDPERERIVEALTKTGGHRGKAAALLGCSRVTLWKNMRRFNL